MIAAAAAADASDDDGANWTLKHVQQAMLSRTSLDSSWLVR